MSLAAMRGLAMLRFTGEVSRPLPAQAFSDWIGAAIELPHVAAA